MPADVLTKTEAATATSQVEATNAREHKLFAGKLDAELMGQADTRGE